MCCLEMVSEDNYPDRTLLIGRYERLNMPVRETSIDKAWEFSTYFFHTLIKQHLMGHQMIIN
ncbi:MAG: hypothetical protein EAZ23_24805 [Oscillatoriales cyanobacterium]|nr:MAG: hypothetical protein EAZ23_24805 [Oscillatoriales cyanobacterium]